MEPINMMKKPSRWKTLTLMSAFLFAVFASESFYLPHLSDVAQGYAQAQEAAPSLPQQASATNPETLRLIEMIERKNRELQTREAELQAREENLKTLEKKVREDLQKIEAALVRSEELAGAREGMIETNIKSLVKVYSSMKSADAASILETVDESIAIQIISRMKSKVAGKILGKMNRPVAKSISERIAGKYFQDKAAKSN